jgi:hypothetical protein
LSACRLLTLHPRLGLGLGQHSLDKLSAPQYPLVKLLWLGGLRKGDILNFHFFSRSSSGS